MWVWARRTGAAKPTPREWGGAAVAGVLLFVCGTGGVVWAERLIPSGVAALVVATEPASFVLIESVRRRRLPRGAVLAGLALGAVGLLVLVGPGHLLGGERFALPALLVLVAGTFCWAGGSLFSRGSRLPASPVMATAVTLLCGGTALAILGAASGELSRFDPAAVSAKSVLATALPLRLRLDRRLHGVPLAAPGDDGRARLDLRLREPDRGGAARVGAGRTSR